MDGWILDECMHEWMDSSMILTWVQVVSSAELPLTSPLPCGQCRLKDPLWYLLSWESSGHLIPSISKCSVPYSHSWCSMMLIDQNWSETELREIHWSCQASIDFPSLLIKEPFAEEQWFHGGQARSTNPLASKAIGHSGLQPRWRTLRISWSHFLPCWTRSHLGSWSSCFKPCE